MRASSSLIGASLLAVLLCACGEGPVENDAASDEVSVDGGTTQTTDDASDSISIDVDDDGGVVDAGEADGGVVDAGEPDAGEDDGGVVDAGEPDGGSEDGGEDPIDVEIPDGNLASGVEIRHVALFQAVKTPLATDRIATALPRNAPIVSGRDAWIRVYVQGTVTGLHVQLEVLAGQERLVLEPFESMSNAVDAPGLNAAFFKVPARLVQPTARYKVRVIDTAGGEPVADGVSHPARFPADGSESPLQAQAESGPLKIMLVPVQYNTDGSGRLPDTSPEQIARMREMIGAIYPTTDVQIQVREPMAWNTALKWPTKNLNFGTLNTSLQNLRKSDRPADDVYYYGLVSPGTSRAGYCGAVIGAGCVTGQSWLVKKPTDATMRVGSGMGFAGDESIETFIHELGHLHGRGHAPCKTTESPEDIKNDPYPHQGGLIGSWGFDSTNGQLHDPKTTADFMGYCNKTWVSDHTWTRLYERIVALNVSAFRMSPDLVPTLIVDVDEEAQAHVEATLDLPVDLGEPGVVVTLLAADDTVLGTTTSRSASTSNDGMTLFVPLPDPSVASLRFTLDRRIHQVSLTP